jgi:hypothetical protein
MKRGIERDEWEYEYECMCERIEGKIKKRRGFRVEFAFLFMQELIQFGFNWISLFSILLWTTQ